MNSIKRILSFIICLIMIITLFGCSSEENDSEISTEENQTTVISEAEAIKIAENELKTALDNNDLIQSWNLYKAAEINTEDLIDDKDNIIEVDMFVNWTAGLQGSIGYNDKITFACGIDKYTGKIIEKEPAQDWESD